jgi:hypothetical protein
MMNDLRDPVQNKAKRYKEPPATCQDKKEYKIDKYKAAKEST